MKIKHEPVKSVHPTGENDNTSFSIEPVRTNKKPVERGTVPSRANPKRGTRLPGNWVLTDKFRIEAQRLRPDLIHRIHDIAESFRDYWISQSGQRGVKLDWLATWRNWLKREKYFAPQPRASGQQRTRSLSAVEIATDTNW
ncbi:hypothetical protein [Microbulbifer sp. GL-2]|uniref:hypothetical protein n=1 Tax=Microbulbifer sp. GL-2 TaxID=2591606 RepID=UPI00155A19B3|nr:hypothetical protein [Microbulbifer sp. GL-2]